MSDDRRRSGFRPDAPSGHCHRHLDSVLDFAERQSKFYMLQVVGTRKEDDSRSTFDMCVVPGHEVFNAEIEGDACRSGSVTRRRPTACPQITTSIQWTNGTPNEDVFPVDLRMDAVPYSLTDSGVGYGSSTCCQGNGTPCTSSGNASCVNAAVGGGANLLEHA